MTGLDSGLSVANGGAGARVRWIPRPRRFMESEADYYRSKTYEFADELIENKELINGLTWGLDRCSARYYSLDNWLCFWVALACCSLIVNIALGWLLFVELGALGV